MDTIRIRLLLSDGNIEEDASIFKNCQSPIIETLAAISTTEVRELNMKDVTFAEFTTIKQMLIGEINESDLSLELYTKASYYGFTDRSLYYIKVARMKNEDREIENFLKGNSDFLHVTEEKYELYKSAFKHRSNIIPVNVLTGGRKRVVAICVYDCCLIYYNNVYHSGYKFEKCFNTSEESYIVDINYLKHKLLFGITLNDNELYDTPLNDWAVDKLNKNSKKYKNNKIIISNEIVGPYILEEEIFSIRDIDAKSIDESSFGKVFSHHPQRIMEGVADIYSKVPNIDMKHAIFFNDYDVYKHQLTNNKVLKLAFNPQTIIDKLIKIDFENMIGKQHYNSGICLYECESKNYTEAYMDFYTTVYGFIQI